MSTLNQSKISNNILETIGKTPLVRLNPGKMLDSKHVADVILKLEFFNPGGSVKDRIAMNMIEEAEKAGLINPEKTDRKSVV